MFNVEMTSTTMELVPLACLCVLTWSGTTFADEHGPAVINMVVKEGNEAILPCSLSSTSIKQEVFDWKKDGQKEVFLYDRGSTYDEKRSGQDDHFKGRVFHFPEHLEFGNASIVIRNTKVADSGNYTCDFPFHQPIRRSHIVLVVGECFQETVQQTAAYNRRDWFKCPRWAQVKFWHGRGCRLASARRHMVTAAFMTCCLNHNHKKPSGKNLHISL